MLPKLNRLPRQQFRQVKRKGKLIQTRLFGVLVHQQFSPHQPSSSRVSFIVSSKVSKKAVLRNRLKRLLREATRSNIDSLSAGFDLVFLAKKTLQNQSLSDISLEVKRVFKTVSNQKTHST